MCLRACVRASACVLCACVSVCGGVLHACVHAQVCARLCVYARVCASLCLRMRECVRAFVWVGVGECVRVGLHISTLVCAYGDPGVDLPYLRRSGPAYWFGPACPRRSGPIVARN